MKVKMSTNLDWRTHCPSMSSDWLRNIICYMFYIEYTGYSDGGGGGGGGGDGGGGGGGGGVYNNIVYSCWRLCDSAEQTWVPTSQ